jgi:carbamate kinase
VLARTVVDPNDRASAAPSKPIGPMYDEATARALAAEYGWAIAPDGGGWRRVVASPRPIAIVEAPTISALVDSGTIVVASGGGGIPVVRRAPGAATSRSPLTGRRGGAAGIAGLDEELAGVEAVVDKDLEAVVLAETVHADVLLLLTDVSAVQLGWGGPNPVPIRRLAASAAFRGIVNGTFAAGSMGPKVQAAAEFAERTGRLAAIGALDRAVDVLAGRTGTVVVPDPVEIVATSRTASSDAAARGARQAVR